MSQGRSLSDATWFGYHLEAIEHEYEEIRRVAWAVLSGLGLAKQMLSGRDESRVRLSRVIFPSWGTIHAPWRLAGQLMDVLLA